MYLHIGNGETIKKDQMIGIFDLDTATVSHATRSYLAKMEKQGRVKSPEGDLPKCFVLLSPKKDKGGKCQKKQDETVLLLRISSTSLHSRAESRSYDDEGQE
ncbi:MAG: DUF370 domain-containing protein [Clostridia bacterium]|nr:DUF370 domain-containing protein [Clostridia bacterium]